MKTNTIKHLLIIAICLLGNTSYAQNSKNMKENKMLMKSITPNLMVADVDKTIEFYEEKLGLKLTQFAPEKKPYFWAALKRDNLEIMLQDVTSLTGEYQVLKGKEIGGSLSFFIRMNGVKEFYEEIKDKVNVISKLHTQPYTSAEFAIQDCNGYILTFAEVD